MTEHNIWVKMEKEMEDEGSEKFEDEWCKDIKKEVLNEGEEEQGKLMLDSETLQPQDITYTTIGTTDHYAFTRLFVFNIWYKYINEKTTGIARIQQVLDNILDILRIDKTNPSVDELHTQITSICCRIEEIFKKYYITKEEFLEKYDSWLNVIQNVTYSYDKNNTYKRKGPRKCYSRCGNKTQRPTARKECEAPIVPCSLRNPGSVAVSTTDVAELIVDAELTREQYTLVQEFVNSQLSYNMLPSYK